MNGGFVLALALWASPADFDAQRFEGAVGAARAATTPQECEAAARAFEALLADGFDSAEVRFNAGNAWLAAGRLGQAIAQYTHAARLRPRDTAIAANLALARQRAGLPPREVDPLDSIVFWQSWLSYREKATTALCVAIVAFGALAVGTWTGRRSARRVGLVVLGGLALFSIALVRDVIEHEFTMRGVVAGAGVVARKGAAAEFAEAFNEPLPEGTTFRVLEARPEWIHAELDGGLDGWLPRSAVAFIGPN